MKIKNNFLEIIYIKKKKTSFFDIFVFQNYKIRYEKVYFLVYTYFFNHIFFVHK
jgi:hypothetical protein